MSKDFFIIQKNSNKNVVLHNVFEYKNIENVIQPNDILFFDDCTFDQYEFILFNQNYLKENNLNCVVAFSTNLYRKESEPPIKNIKTEELHRLKLNRGFVSLSELTELIRLNNVFLALHGHSHFNPKNTKVINSMMTFRDELNKSIMFLKNLNLKTEIFVYPHDYIVRGTESLLNEKGFKYIYPSQRNSRIYIEELFNETT